MIILKLLTSVANVIAATANSGLSAPYGAGTDEGVGWKPSHLKLEEAKDIALSLNKEADKLAEVASTGDIEAIKDQFGKIGKTCKGCHDSFRIRDR